MRLGLLLWVALLVTALSTAGWAESDPAPVEEPASWDAPSTAAPDAMPAEEEVEWSDDFSETDFVEADTAGDDWAEDSEVDSAATDEAVESDDDFAWDESGDAEDVAEQGLTPEPHDDGVWPTQDAPVEAAATSEPQIEPGTQLVVNGVMLGPVGIDAKGRVGRVHTVKTGDTLWDISHAYLGTAWVWPSVWGDNNEIQNPHLIEPGDRLWISSTEIRAISDEEADAYVAEAEVQQEPEIETVAAEIPEDVEFEEIPEDADEFLDMAAMDEFAGDEMDALPVGMPEAAARGNETGRTVRVSMRENMSFVSDVQLQAATSILGSPSDRKYLSMLDTIYFGLGEGEVEVGDEFTFFRNITDVRSPSTNQLIGYHVDVLGWAEVIEVTGDTCVAVIRVSIDGAIEGDRVMPRYQPPSDIKVKYPQDDIEGEIAFLPASRTLMGTTDYVFLDVGAVHGVEIGTDLEVYDRGHVAYDNARRMDMTTPDRVIADLVVVTVQEESAVAFVAHTRRELAVGDSVRGATRDFPGSF